jgi:predicted transcriptional regulator
MFNIVERPMKTSSIGARIPDTLKYAVNELATLSGQSVSAVTEAALREYIGWRVPQLLDLQEAVKAADRGDFATEDEVNEFFARHGA